MTAAAPRPAAVRGPWAAPAGLRGLVLVVGPDGAGKTTLADRLAAAAEAAGVPVVRAHFAPGLLVARGGPGGPPVSDPHARRPRGPVGSLAKLALTFADFAAGAPRWRRARRRGLVVLERGWFDQAVDPRRYRLDPRTAPLVRALGRLLPRADLAVVVAGDPAAIVARKPEIGPAEVARQQAAWRSLAARAARRVAVVDTVAADRDEAAAAAIAALGPPAPGPAWRSVPAPARLALRATAGRDGAAALAIYRPTRPAARAVAAASAAALRRGWARPAPPPIEDLAGLARRVGVACDGGAVLRSQRPGRLVVGLAAAGRLVAVAKVGPAGDPGLEREAEVLAHLAGAAGVRVPALLWAGEWRDRFVVATAAVPAPRRTPRVGVDAAAEVATRLTLGPAGRPLVHGDLASWNFLDAPGGPVLADWEAARFGAEPLADLTHFVVQEGALLGRLSPRRAARLLTAPDGPGAAHLAAVGIDPGEAPALVARQVAAAAGDTPALRRFLARMAEALP